MKHPLLRWILPLLRYGLCVVAILYLYFNVSWYDHVTLNGPTGEKLQLVRADAEDLIVLRDGREARLTVSDVHRIPGTEEPEVIYGIRGVVTGLDWRLAGLSLLIFGPVPFFSAVRLVLMLRIQDVRLTVWEAVKLTFAGNFFNFALPGTTGGDLIKAYYITRYTHHKTEAVTAVVLDRVIGLLGLMMLASLLFALAWKQLNWDAAYRNSLASALGLVWAGLAIGCLVVFSSRLRGLFRLSEIAARLPAGEHLQRIGRATVAMRTHKALTLWSLVITIGLQGLVVWSAFMMARGLGMEGPASLFFICVPIGFLIAAIPISPPQAIGVLEWAYIQFFTQEGLNPISAAVAFALLVRLIQLVWAIPGVLVPLLGAHMPSKAELADMESADAGAAGPGSDPPNPVMPPTATNPQ